MTTNTPCAVALHDAHTHALNNRLVRLSWHTSIVLACVFLSLYAVVYQDRVFMWAYIIVHFIHPIR